MIVQDGKVIDLLLEPSAGLTVSSAESVLSKL
jgi:peroxiredoxin